MQNGVLETHLSADAGKPLDERLSAAANLEGVSLLYVGQRRSKLDERDFAGEMATSLREMTSRLSSEELGELLAEAGVEDIPTGSRDDLVDLYNEIYLPQTAEECILDVLPFGGTGVRHFRRLLFRGGSKEVGKRDVAKGTEEVISIFPDVLLFDRGNYIVEQVPREIANLMRTATDAQLDGFEMMADTCVDILSFLRCAADLYGIAVFQDLVDQWRDLRGYEPAPLVKSAVVRAVYQNDDQGFSVLADTRNDRTYVVSNAFAHAMCRPDGTLRQDYVNDILRRQAALEAPRMVDKPYLGAATIPLFVMATDEAARLVKVLDEYVPQTMSDRFALEVTARFIVWMRDMDEADLIDTILEKCGLRPTGALAKDIRIACEDLNRVIPKWHLRGWTIAELDERDGRERPLSVPSIDPDAKPEDWEGVSGFVSTLQEDPSAVDDQGSDR